MANAPLLTLRDSRLNKKAALERLGIKPYPSKAHRTHYARPLVDDFAGFEGQSVTVAGRLLSWRKQGGLIFGHVQDMTGRIQLYIRRDTIEETNPNTGSLGFADLVNVDVGDIVETTGAVTKTKSGEISILVSQMRVLTKSLRPLPDKWSGLKDREQILRKRYLDVTVSPEHRERFEKIARMLASIRGFLNREGFLEFMTPVLQPQYGGGTAKPFRTHINALGYSAFLSISHELYLKRLIIAGFDKVYTIGKYFRNEGMDRSHHPEFSMVETMTAYEDYTYNMDLIEAMFRTVAQEAFGKTVFNVRGHEIDFAKPWKRISMADVVKEVTGIDFLQFQDVQESNAALTGLGLEPQPSIGHGLLRAFEAKGEAGLIEPTLVYGHPIEISPLAKPTADDPRFAERFEIFIAAMECGDNWSEQNDPVELLAHWRRAKENAADESEAHPLEYDFIEALEHGMPPTTGIGPGIERMAMIFTGEENIDDVIFFPLMRPATNEINRQLYGDDAAVSQAPVRPHEEAVPLSLDEFETVAQQGIVKPHSKVLEVQPVLRLWKSPSFLGRWRASGYLSVNGVFQSKALLLVGYSAGSEERLDLAQEKRNFEDLIELGFTQPVKRLFSDCTIRIGDIAVVDDPS